MNKNKKRLLHVLDVEGKNIRQMFLKRDYYIAYLISDPQIKIWKYQKLLRKTEYYYSKYKKGNLLSILNVIPFIIYKRRKNNIGNKLGIDIRENSVDEGLMIYHNNIIINGHARIGKNCKLHGNNCIGNDGKSNKTPIIGDNVDIGFGAIIIGDVKIANNVSIAAGAVVIKSILEEGSTYAGVPAIKKR